MSLEPAKIKLLSVDSGPPEIAVKFNPTELSMQRGVNYAEVPIPGLQVPLLQFVRGEAQTLTVELFLDGEVGADLEELRKLITVQKKTHAPPVVQFEWGDADFTGVVTSLEERFTLFDNHGNVTRARVTVTFKSYSPPEIDEPETESPDITKTHVVKHGDRLDLIAYDEYGSSSFWPIIAEANGIERVRELEPGTVLTLPPLQSEVSS